MTAQDFCIELKQSIPAADKLRKLGLDEKFIDDLRLSYACQPKNVLRSTQNELVNFVVNYAGDEVEIGMVIFKNDIEEDGNFYYVGFIESHHLVVDKNTGQLMVIDWSNLEHVLWHCAETGEQFLDAMAVSGRYLTERLFNDLESSNEIRRMVKKTTTLAGGDKYINFYKTMLGSEE